MTNEAAHHQLANQPHQGRISSIHGCTKNGGSRTTSSASTVRWTTGSTSYALRARNELEASRHLPQNVFQQASSMPIYSITSETGWVRSPEVGTPSQRSPSDRDKTVTGTCALCARCRPERRTCFSVAIKRKSTAAMLAMIIERGIDSYNAQLHDLLQTLGMCGRSTPSTPS